jgi:hypothetical protein
MNLKLNLNYKAILPVLRKLQPVLFGVGLIAVFAYTSLIVNAALNVEADPAVAAVPDPAAKIIFDKNTIASLKNLDVVEGSVPTGDLGKDDPFK